jgi:hypothetical protein
MSWIHRFNRILARGTSSANAPESAPPEPPAAADKVEPAWAQPEKDPLPTPPRRPSRQTKADAAKRPVSPHLAARAAAVKAVAEAMRKAQNQAEAAANARAILAKMGVKIPAPAPSLSRDRRALIAEAMGHWARGHAIYEKLDPGLKERVRQLAERMAPK